MEFVGPYSLPVVSDSDEADMPVFSGEVAARVGSALDGKAPSAKSGGRYAWLPPVYGQTAVYVWNSDVNTPPVDGSQPGYGSMIGLQWKPYTPGEPVEYSLRAHIDAKPGAVGRRVMDLAEAHHDRVAGAAAANIPLGRAVMGYQNANLSIFPISGKYVLASSSGFQGNLAFEAGSSAAIKTVDAEAVPDYEGMVSGLAPVVFTYDDDPETVGSPFAGTTHTGFLAEQVAEMAGRCGVPSAVVTSGPGGKPTGLSDRDLIAVLWGAVRVLQDRVVSLEEGAR